jgi:hypothetical protein
MKGAHKENRAVDARARGQAPGRRPLRIGQLAEPCGPRTGLRAGQYANRKSKDGAGRALAPESVSRVYQPGCRAADLAWTVEGSRSTPAASRSHGIAAAGRGSGAAAGLGAGGLLAGRNLSRELRRGREARGAGRRNTACEVGMRAQVLGELLHVHGVAVNAPGSVPCKSATRTSAVTDSPRRACAASRSPQTAPARRTCS